MIPGPANDGGRTARPRGPLPWWVLAPGAGIGGLLASLAFAPFGLWPLAFVAVAVLAWCVGRTARPGASVLVGWVFGLTFMATSLIWQTSIMVLSYAGLTLVTSLVYALVGGLAHLTRDLRLAPLWGASAWSVGEFVLSVFPFDGFMWMRLGYTQLDSWLAGFYPLAGAASVTFLVALLGHLVAHVAAAPGLVRGVALLVAAALTVGVGLLGATWHPEGDADQTVDVGWVQGGAPGGGVYGLGLARTITFNQRDQTIELVQAIERGEYPRPAFIAWPENSTDLDPRLDAPTRIAVEDAVRAAGVPILVGSIFTDDAREERQTVAVWWTRDGTGPIYAKRNLVPFGEWIPFREVLLPLIPPLEYVGYQSVPGTEPGSLDVTLPDGGAVDLGVAICYEVIYPETMYDAARAGAELMIVQSSNAMYQGTNQIDQQFAATRVRAAEMRREILVVTTSGVSGLIGPTGEVLDRAAPSIGTSGVHALPRRTHATPAMAVGRWVEYLLVAQGLVGVGLGLSGRARASRGGRMERTPASRQ